MSPYRASTQTVRLKIRAIQHGILELDGNEFRGVLEVSGIGHAFDDEARTESTLAGFAAFLNGLSYPVQILVRTCPVDLTPYLARLEQCDVRDGPLSELAHDHAMFVQELARGRTLLERHVYVVVPAESSDRGGWLHQTLRRGGAHDSSEPRHEAAERQVNFRCEDLARQLGRCGVSARRLVDLELAHLYLACWSPERARAQRFRQQLSEYSTLAVHATAPGQVVD